MRDVKPLRAGQYIAKRRQKTLLAAVVAGHSRVWPQADVTVQEGWARFYKDGKEVWSCNPLYAAARFDIEKVKK